MSKPYSKQDAAWDKMYSYAEQYYSEYGNLEVPQKYKTADGHNLGSWISRQRMIYQGKLPRKKRKLGKDKIEKLEAIGMIWDWGGVKNLKWQRHYEAAKAYYEEHGNLNIPREYETQDGIKLGSWLKSQRLYKRGIIKNESLTEERIAALDEIGMVWEVIASWREEWFAAAEEYYRENGHLTVPRTYCTPNGEHLGKWIGELRKIRTGKAEGATPLTEEQIARLDAMGMIWKDCYKAKWEKNFAAAEKYYQREGHLNVPIRYRTVDGINLGSWVLHQRLLKQGKAPGTPLTKEQVIRLTEIGMIWTNLRQPKRK